MSFLWLGKKGAPWRDLPERFGPWRTVATRFYRWTRSGLWDRLLAELRRVVDAKGGLDWEVHMVDGTSVRAHRCAAGGKGAAPPGAGPLAWRGSKLHLRCDRRGRPMVFVLTPGHRHEQTAFRELMLQGAVKRSGRGRPRLRPRTVVGDKGYTGQPVRDHLRCRGVSAVIPQLRTEKTPRLMDGDLYRERNARSAPGEPSVIEILILCGVVSAAVGLLMLLISMRPDSG